MCQKIKCFLGFHKSSSTAEADPWTKKAYTICVRCGKEYRIKYPYK